MYGNEDAEITVIVTGVGALIGHGIIRSLRCAGGRIRVVGIDRNPDAYGARDCDAFHRKPDDEGLPSYLDFWVRTIRSEQARLVIPGLDVDCLFLSRHRSELEAAGARLCLNTDPLLALGQDKWQLSMALAEVGAYAIPSMISGDWEQCVEVLGAPPLLMKPRHGSAGRGIVRLHDAEDFHYWRRKAGAGFMIQRIVGSDDEEYTAGVFGLGDGESLPPIVFRRRLSASGSTGYAEVVSDPAVEAACAVLSRYFRPVGPTNYQFRKSADALYLLEINPRFSSSSSLRTAFGYNEAAMALDYFLHARRPPDPVIGRGRAWRYTEDIIAHDRHPV